jgi:hypothetical protein
MKSFGRDASPGFEEQKFDRRTARFMSFWCLWWLTVYAVNYVQLTWRLISDLEGLPWIMIISPCFWAWVTAFSLSTLVAERLITVSWHRFEKELSLAKVAATILILPFGIWIVLSQICPYLYPAVSGTLRLVPIIGGRGF